jgi:Ca2+-binding EF-hand superfamily protein
LTLTKDSSKAFSIAYIIVSVLVVAAAIGNFGLVQMEIAAEKRREAMLARKLDLHMIREMDKDGDGVDKLEFLCACLVQMELVEQKDIDPWLKRFDELDADGSGKLDAKDLELFAEQVCVCMRKVS